MDGTCSSLNCNERATLQCPICIKLCLKPSYFCTQDCFKSFYPFHKQLHTQNNKNLFENYKFTGKLRPRSRSPQISHTSDVIKKLKYKPDYHNTTISKGEDELDNITLFTYNSNEIEKIKVCAEIARGALDEAHKNVNIGVTTGFLNKVVFNYITERGGYPSPLNYRGFPKSLCTSVNEVICHGIPDNRPLEDGDIVNCDVTVYYDGYHVDLNETFGVGNVQDKYIKLMKASYDSMMEAIKICKPGVMYREIGNTIESICNSRSFSVVKSYCGHGTGKLFHCNPNIMHYKNSKTKGIMQEGHVFTIEPMVNEGVYKDTTWPDQWTSVTVDGKRSAQFEHTILITKDGYEILSKRTKDSPKLYFEDEYKYMYN